MDRKRIYAFLLAMILTVSSCFGVLADVRGVQVATGSDAYALMTSDLSDDDIMPLSSIGTVTNTVDLDYVFVAVFYYDSSGNYKKDYAVARIEGNRLLYDYEVPSGGYIRRFQVELSQLSLPPVGNYLFSLDHSSHFSMEYSRMSIFTDKSTNNASTVDNNIPLDFEQSAGDFYVPPVAITLTNVNRFIPWIDISGNDQKYLSGSFAISFVPTSEAGSSTAGSDTSTQDYENNVSSSLGSLSSSVDEISEGITYISQSQNLIIQGIDNVIMHISNQLYAFWDQLYNLIHVPTYALMQQILKAIQDLEINITVDLDGLKQTIQNVTNQQISNDNKLNQEQIKNDNANHEQLVNGFDNSSMAAEQDRLDSVLNDYQAKEDELLDAPMDNISGFEFEDHFERFTQPLHDISYLLSGIYEGLGALNIPIGFSLSLTIALLFIGYYRFKGGG